MTPEELGELCQARINDIVSKYGDDADADVVVPEALNIDSETIQLIADYVHNHVQQHIFDQSVQGGGMNPSEFLNMVLGTAIPATLLSLRVLDRSNAGSNDKYMTTVVAELSLKNMISENKDLSDIWPAEYVSEITKTFDDPNEAFLAGVICGNSNG